MALTGFCALVLLVLSAPRVLSAFQALPGQPVLDRVNRTDAVGVDALWTLADSRYRALEWSEDPRYKVELGAAMLRLAVAAGEDTPDKDLLNTAIEALRAGLAAAPADRAGWAQLALAEYLRAGPSREVAGYLRMSILAGAFDRRLAFLRLDLASRNWRYIDPADRELVLGQARLAWAAMPRRVLKVTKKRLPLAIVRAALARDSRALQRFETARARTKPDRSRRAR